MSDNPLKKLYRHKNYYTKIPSGGRFYKNITLSADGEVGVMPMTAADEIKLKSPDILFNGEALLELFRSCIPDIPEPEEMPACDVDVLLIAIRSASSDGKIEIGSKCTECGEDESYEIELSSILGTMKTIPEENTVHIEGDVVVEVRPSPLKTQTKTQVEAFYQYRMQQSLNSDNMTDADKAKIFDEALIASITLQVAQVADSIVSVTIPDEDEKIRVTDYEHIMDWTRNMDRITHRKISDRIKELNQSGLDTNVSLKCPHCEHMNKTKIELNPANFF